MIAYGKALSVAELQTELHRANVELVRAEMTDSWFRGQRMAAKVRERIADLEKRLADASVDAAQAPIYRLRDGQIEVQTLKGGRWEPVEDPDALLARLGEAAALLSAFTVQPLRGLTEWTGTPCHFLRGGRPDLAAHTAGLLKELGL